MLSRLHRFHGYGSLRHVYSNGNNIRGTYIGLRFGSRPKGKSYRVAVVVSKKVNKSAVARNRIRRRIYESVRQSELVPEQTDLIFTVFNNKVSEIAPKELDSTIKELLQRAVNKTQK